MQSKSNLHHLWFVLVNLPCFTAEMKYHPYEHNLVLVFFLGVLLSSLSIAQHPSSTGRQAHSESREHHASQNSQQRLAPNPNKDAMTQTFVFNRKLHNVGMTETEHIHKGISMERPQQNYQQHDQRRREGNDLPDSHSSRSAEQPEQNHLKHDQWRPETSELSSSNTPISSHHLSDTATPFSISIEGKHFYGGLVTYSHDLHPARICRVMNACIRNDDTLVLPQWMQRHDNTLKFQCGYSNIDFSLPDNESPPSLKRLDLVGVTSSRPSMPDFIRDFMPSAVVFDLIYGDHQVLKSCHSRKGKDCYSFPSLTESFRPAVVLHPRIRSLDGKKSWVRQFIELMKPPHYGNEAEILYQDSFRQKDADLTCFRSVLFTRGPFNRNFIMDDHLRQIHFLDRNGIMKKPRDVMPPQDSFSSSRVCSLNVTITNRKRMDRAQNTLVGRYITNVPAIRDAIVDRTQRIPGLHLNLAAMTLEDKSLRWQINAMQKTDIWVAGHGPLLTNMLFLREKSSVLEIQPFAYYPQTFEKIAERLAHVSYERYISDPDVEAFKTCINQIYDETHPARNEATKLLDRYMQASKKYFESDNTHTLILHGLSAEDMLPVKKCAEMQRLTVNARNFAVAVVRHARVRCGFPKPTLSNTVAEQNENGL